MISVIIPTYNRVHWIGNAIRSVLNQTFKEIEIIVIDDGSEDGAEEIVQRDFRQSKIPIKYYKKDHKGCASARNKGIECATGDFIAFLDSDDQWVSEALETLVLVLNSSNADFVYSPAIEVYPNGVERINKPVAAENPDQLAVEHFKVTNVRLGSLLYRKEVFEKMKIWFREELKHNEDSDFLQRAAIEFRAAYSSSPTVKVFHHSANKSKDRVSMYRALLQSSEDILRKFPEFKKQLGITAEKRIEEIKKNLLRMLVLSSRFREAREVSEGLDGSIGIEVRLSLWLHSNLPLKVGNKIRSRFV
jgi:glycosyltransferase involved in cell wall biosynthesis